MSNLADMSAKSLHLEKLHKIFENFLYYVQKTHDQNLWLILPTADKLTVFHMPLFLPLLLLFHDSLSNLLMRPRYLSPLLNCLPLSVLHCLLSLWSLFLLTTLCQNHSDTADLGGHGIFQTHSVHAARQSLQK